MLSRYSLPAIGGCRFRFALQTLKFILCLYSISGSRSDLRLGVELQDELHWDKNSPYIVSRDSTPFGECQNQSETQQLAQYTRSNLGRRGPLKELATSDQGDMFTLDRQQHRLWQLAPNGTDYTVFASQREALLFPLGLAVDNEAGLVYVSSQSRLDCFIFDFVCCKNSKLVAFKYAPFDEVKNYTDISDPDEQTREPEYAVVAEVSPGINPDDGLCEPTSIALDKTGGNLFIANTENLKIQKMALFQSFEEIGNVDNSRLSTIMEFKSCHQCTCLATPEGECPPIEQCECLGPQNSPMPDWKSRKGDDDFSIQIEYRCLPDRPYCISPDERDKPYAIVTGGDYLYISMTKVYPDFGAVILKVFIRGEGSITPDNISLFRPYSNSIFSHPSSLAFQPLVPVPEGHSPVSINQKSNEGYLVVANEYTRGLVIFDSEGQDVRYVFGTTVQPPILLDKPIGLDFEGERLVMLNLLPANQDETLVVSMGCPIETPAPTVEEYSETPTEQPTSAPFEENLEVNEMLVIASVTGASVILCSMFAIGWKRKYERYPWESERDFKKKWRKGGKTGGIGRPSREYSTSGPVSADFTNLDMAPLINRVIPFGDLDGEQLSKMTCHWNDIIIKDVNNLKLDDQIGNGSAGTVYRGQYQDDNVAIKRIATSSLSSKVSKGVVAEADMLAQLVHPNIVKFLGMALAPNAILLVTELCCCSLQDFLETPQEESNLMRSSLGANPLKAAPLHPFGSALILDMAVQIVEGILYLLESGIMHRDLKPGNVLLNIEQLSSFKSEADFEQQQPMPSTLVARGTLSTISSATSKTTSVGNTLSSSPFSASADGSDVVEIDAITTENIRTSAEDVHVVFQRQAFVKLCDFGLAKKIVGLNTHTMTACLGTPAFMAPELVSESSNARYSPKSDVYSFGILLWCMATGNSPYEDLEISNIFSLMSEVVGGLRPTITSELNEIIPYAALMQRCWLPEKDQRPDFEEVLSELLVLREAEISTTNGNHQYRSDMERYFQVLRMKEANTKKHHSRRKQKKGKEQMGLTSKESLSYTGPKNCRRGLPQTSRQRSYSSASLKSRASLSDKNWRLVTDRKMASSVKSASRENMKMTHGLQPVLQQTLGGDFGSMRELVRLPPGVRKEEWLMLHMPDFYADICVMYGLVASDNHDEAGCGLEHMCTEHTCPKMSAGPKYVWKDHEGQDIAAPIYIQKLLTWVQTEVNDPQLFPTDADSETVPPDTLARVKIMMGLIFRVYAHLYHAHLSHIAENGAHVHLNTCFKRFLFFAEEFQLLEDSDLAPLQGVVLSMRAKEPWVQPKKLKAIEPSS